MSNFAHLTTQQLNREFIALCVKRAVTKDRAVSAGMLEQLNHMDAELTRREGAPNHVAGSH